MSENNDLSAEAFAGLLSGLRLDGAERLAAGVSGGPDSLALAKLLSDWAAARGKSVHLVTVDHGLRAESSVEARGVAAIVRGWPGAAHFILTWEGEKPEARVQEEARRARYALMAAHCRAHGISHLLLAHHADDQAETVLFRLAKGSGLDGLCGMRALQEYDAELVLVRPFLGVEKAALVAVCAREGLEYVDDPSNDDEAYARVRLRQALAGEGLSAKRMGVTARRLQRAHEALAAIAEEVFAKAKQGSGAGRVVLDWAAVREQPEEIGLRVLLKVIRALRPDEDYLPRMEKIEDLFCDLRRDGSFRKRTLGGLVFERGDSENTLVVSMEK